MMMKYPPGAIHDTSTRVLLAIQQIHGRDGVVTIPELCDAVDRTRGTVHARLLDLYVADLADWRDGAQGTLHPLVEPAQIGTTTHAPRRNRTSFPPRRGVARRADRSPTR